mmetsp:Transcript_39413/g.113774  ORF Transcript_39413/g.113774 Transcript_39413/m.113774 type:complete len:277 (-) Transcript_39413:167-997(-)
MCLLLHHLQQKAPISNLLAEQLGRNVQDEVNTRRHLHGGYVHGHLPSAHYGSLMLRALCSCGKASALFGVPRPTTGVTWVERRPDVLEDLAEAVVVAQRARPVRRDEAREAPEEGDVPLETLLGEVVVPALQARLGDLERPLGLVLLRVLDPLAQVEEVGALWAVVCEVGLRDLERAGGREQPVEHALRLVNEPLVVLEALAGVRRQQRHLAKELRMQALSRALVHYLDPALDGGATERLPCKGVQGQRHHLHCRHAVVPWQRPGSMERLREPLGA